MNSEIIYNEVIKELGPYLNNLDFGKIAKHNAGYLKYKKDPLYYFCHSEKKRFCMAADFIRSSIINSNDFYLDIGTFIPVVPLMIKKLGGRVEVVEKFSLYDNALQSVVDLMTSQGIEVHDLDIVYDDLSKILTPAKYSFITCQATIEHLCGSPLKLLSGIKTLLKPGGYLILDTPNAASLAKRLIMFFKGIPFHSSYSSSYYSFDDFINSEYPFTGHNREYTLRELKYILIKKLGFKETEFELFNLRNFSDKKFNWKGKIVSLLSLFYRGWRDYIMCIVKK